MLKILKWIVIIFLGLLVAGFIFVKAASKPLPEGVEGVEADALAHKMLEAVNKEAWDSTRYLQWNFIGLHDFFWDKERHLVEVKWGDNVVLLNPNEISGKAWKGGEELEEDAAYKMVQKAWMFFCNDEFWLNAPFKVFDPGTKRSLVTTEEGKAALMISYTSGGVTPGDAYLWHLGEDGLPTSWQMWVKVIPVKGASSTWESWITQTSGAKMATLHKTFGISADIRNLKTGQTLEEMGRTIDVFAELQ